MNSIESEDLEMMEGGEEGNDTVEGSFDTVIAIGEGSELRMGLKRDVEDRWRVLGKVDGTQRERFEVATTFEDCDETGDVSGVHEDEGSDKIGESRILEERLSE